MTATLDFSAITLAYGPHERPEDGLCAMEAVAYVMGEPHSDHPQCVSPVIAAALRRWNDLLPDADRDRCILPLLPQVVGTRTTDADEITRSYLAADWAVRIDVAAYAAYAAYAADAAAVYAADAAAAAAIRESFAGLILRMAEVGR